MSELIRDQQQRKNLLKHMILQLHTGGAPDAVRTQLVRLLGKVPYDEVVEVEQELIAEGLPQAEVLQLCDLHHQALQGAIDLGGARTAPAGHPAHTFAQENAALSWEVQELRKQFAALDGLADGDDPTDVLHAIRGRFNNLMDVEKHYLRKEHLLFPFLEKKGITGPPTVMWGKHDETRALLKSAQAALGDAGGAAVQDLQALAELVLEPAAESVAGMVDKETQILLPMCLDQLTDAEWYEIALGTDEIGYCLYAPEVVWRPEGAAAPAPTAGDEGGIRLSTGALDARQLEAILGTIPFDITFVDADDVVRYFSHGQERIFARSNAILGRKVQYCHPPKSVDTVERIVGDFKAGRQSRAAFWIQMGGKFISIEYFALRGGDGEYLGTLEVSQDLTAKRALSGERRLLSYDDPEASRG
ncbi:MAG TPA: DUF438 domain-containing protein [Candidatus Krumholzibacteria bacterium]|nr:DUF438 domain-containing protein [Candidatus Krumholzibacteria bacterium]HPD70526.1 DUF438 domain-containing protein [Candidatus Krumholzibacteria bacterium]HRY39774.1 DUF438 domain-containing protein [Candidatus Krumholzibacteria bacterium]